MGLGQMGYPMARNLRLKLPADLELSIFDVNKDATKKFVDELGASSRDVVVSDSPEDVAANCVSPRPFSSVL